MDDTESKPQVTVKYDWYQTEANVVITILAKNVVKDKTRIAFDPQTVSVQLTLPDDNEHVRKLNLAHIVDPAQCSYVVSAAKVEVKLKKVDGIRWASLESTGEETLKQIPQGATSVTSGPPSYPTSKPGRDWSAIEREIREQEAKEKPVGEEALNKLFQDIYGKGDDNVKKAMNKSYMESGGTVLSTNWTEIAKERVEVKPPDGMEFKKWDA
ncbi:hypothetical protein ILUMI_01708 [Ignelater luminosus]|uniref:SGT1 protein n=1 Tax=Ignelater luminosus TaxID=2038154 RepID=A0A8K0GNY0_IGNLU|nr:hypothetical protein ILUMI_01708 [Ignelater luminosus]